MANIDYEKIIHTISDWLWEVDAHGVYTYCSENVYDILGFLPHEIIGKTPFDFMSQEEALKISAQFQQFVSQRKNIIRFENRHLHKDGHEVIVETNAVPIFDSHGNFTGYQGLDKDITTQKHKEQELTTTLQQNSAFFESFKKAADESNIISKSDLKGKITYVNDNLCEVTGYTKEELLGKPHSIVRHPDMPSEIFADLWMTIQSKQTWKNLLKNRKKDGSHYWVDISISPILDIHGEIVEYIAIRHDVTQMIDQKIMLDNLANTDTLTGFGNRYKLTQDIKQSYKPALAIVNIDNFSQINDFYGHEKGDQVIKCLGDIIQNNIKSTNCELYHLQGDEYVILDTDTKKEDFYSLITMLSQKVPETAITVGEESVNLGLSIAISFEKKQNLHTTADMALKVAKSSKQNILVYSEEISLNKEYENNLKWTRKIKDAIANDQITPVFQPLVNNTTLQWEKFESLVRIQEEDRLISPFFFLEISKKTKYYETITKAMLDKTFETFAKSDKEFSLNLTIDDITSNTIKSHIFLLLEMYKGIGPRVVFEIVESESIENFDQTDEFIEGIKSYGCKIAIDDFGTGYSNFEYLIQIQADYIKIDGSIIKKLPHTDEAKILVKTIVKFATELGMKTIAEFVEDKEIFEQVKALGIDYSQGYYFSKPKKELPKHT